MVWRRNRFRPEKEPKEPWLTDKQAEWLIEFLLSVIGTSIKGRVARAVGIAALAATVAAGSGEAGPDRLLHVIEQATSQ